MRIHSTWLATDASSEDIGRGAEKAGADPNRQTRDPDGRLFPIFQQFTDRSETPWQTSTATGTWLTGLAEIRASSAYSENRLVGVIAPTPSLLLDLLEQTEEIFRDFGIHYQRSNFELEQLLAPEVQQSNIYPMSVRLRDQNTTTLIQADDSRTLRRSIAVTNGELMGVTVRAADQLLSVLPGGNVIFNEPSIEGVLRAMFSLASVFGAPTVAATT
jgi:hypothetical protein